MFIGRKTEINQLESAYHSSKNELAALYGRRRIGKSALIETFLKDKPFVLRFEAIEAETAGKQLAHFSRQVTAQLNEPLLKSRPFRDWPEALDYITAKFINPALKGQKRILFLDELQWMASGRSKLVSLLKYYWDVHWKDHGLMLILCGSISSFMVKNVIRSKAFYGRLTLEMHLKGLLPAEARLMFRGRRSPEEILRYLLVFGCVPKYLEEINLHRSFNQNINALCFSADGLMFNEIKRIFHSQFRDPAVYLSMVSLLKKNPLTLNEISRSLKIPSGGGLKSYLDNLLLADMVMPYVPYGKKRTSKFTRYGLMDEFLHFYYSFMDPHLEMIQTSISTRKFETVAQSRFDIWLGFAFKRFCLKHAGLLARLMGFGDEILFAAPCFGRPGTPIQIDLVYERADKITTLCEIKHINTPVTTSIIPEMQRKISLFEAPKGYSIEKALISLYGPDKPLAESGYFNHIITLKDLLS